ncbi:MAG: CBS domain-containing protein [Firmicutes bacterium]|nr:CBS domain-containing protein [Bacillota bacterium]
MEVRELMTEEPASVPEGATLEEAMAVMRAAGLRAVPVVREGRPVGVLELAELLRLGVGRPSAPVPGTRLVASLMAPAPAGVRPSASWAEAARRMSEEGLDWLPVVDEEGLLVGVLGLRALFRAMLRLLGWGVTGAPGAETGRPQPPERGA